MKATLYIILVFASAFVGLVAGLFIDRNALMRSLLPFRVWLSHLRNPLSKHLDRHRKKFKSRMHLNQLYEKAVDYLKTSEAYLNPDLKLVDVSRAIFTNRQYLSYAMRLSNEKSFVCCVNRLRIHHAMVLFIKNQKLSVTEMSSMSGFNCPNTFRRAFRENVGKSPLEWCNEYRRKTKKR